MNVFFYAILVLIKKLLILENIYHVGYFNFQFEMTIFFFMLV